MPGKPKPAHLGLKYAEQFKDSSIVAMYHYRPPYPDEAIKTLLALIADEPRTVLDAGCGTGDLARRLVNEVERVDAVDFSQAMIKKGKTLPQGNHLSLHWIYGPVEQTTLRPPYALITAGESLHWMAWDIVLPLFASILTPHGYLAIVERGTTPNPWDNALLALIRRFATNREYQPYNLTEELEERQLFQKQNIRITPPVTFVQTAEEYIQSIHSRNGFSLDRMGKDAADTFDREVSTLLTPFLQDGWLKLSVTSETTWGKPQKLA